MNSKNNTQFTSLLDAVSALEKATYAFYNGINSDTDSVFADKKDFTKKYKSAYNSFSVTLADCISNCEPHVLSLTDLIKKADKNQQADLTARLCAEFDRYVKFSEGISDFILQNEKIIKDGNYLNKAEIVVLVQNLLSTIQNYIKELQPTD